jgi:hypothetical protein
MASSGISGNIAREKLFAMKHSFAHYYFQMFLHPRAAFRALAVEEKRLRFAFWTLLLMALVYTLVYVFLILGGGRPFHPWLDIPEESYYRWNVFFLAPSMILGWILAAGVVQLLSRFLGGKGNFEDTLAVLGFGIGIASWSTGLHDLVTSFLGGIGLMDQNAYEAAMNSPGAARTLLWALMGAYLVWFWALFSLGVGAVHRIRGWRAVVAGVIGFVVYQSFFLIFNR